MSNHFLHPPYTRWQPNSKKNSFPTILQTVSISFVTLVLGFSLPAAAEPVGWRHPSDESLVGSADFRPTSFHQPLAQNLSFSPVPDSEGIPQKQPTPTDSGQKPPAGGSQGQKGTDKEAERGKPAENGSTPGSIKRKGNSLAGTSDKGGFFSSLLAQNWSFYFLLTIVFLSLLWLGLLTWLAYKSEDKLKQSDKSLYKDYQRIKAELKRQESKLSSQDFLNTEAKSLSGEITKKITNLENALFSVQTFLRQHEDRLLELQAIQKPELNPQSDKQDHARIFSAQPPSNGNQTEHSDPGESVAKDYQDAYFRNDRAALRRLMNEELNITQNSEDALMKTSSFPTQLEVVKAGGSYLLIHRAGRHWLVPEFQILSSFTTNQLAKGIFSYDREGISSAELRRPAEVRDLGGLWEVVVMGVIAVPT
jgi:hypothetical protein